MLGNLIFLTKIDIKRTFRDSKYVFLIIMLPLIFYIMYNLLFKTKNLIDGSTWESYSMVSLAAFGIMGNCITSFGTKVAQEKSQKWYTFLKISNISESLYGISKIISNLILSVTILIVIFFVAYVFYDVRISLYKWLGISIALILGSLVFNMLGLLIGNFKTVTQPVATAVYLILSFLGGLWIPVSAMPTSIEKIAKLTPTYNYGNIAWSILGGKSIEMRNIIILIIYLILFLIIYKILNPKRKYNN
ncbi:MAG: ABC transporter permease [Sarcina sp.]